MLEDIHHVAFVVQSVDSAVEFLERAFDLKPISRTQFLEDGVDLAIYQLGKTYFEITAPIGDRSALADFLARRGPGIDHVAFGVTDIDDGLRKLATRGVETADKSPRTGRSGWTVVTVNSAPELGIAVQLVQLAGDEAAG